MVGSFYMGKVSPTIMLGFLTLAFSFLMFKLEALGRIGSIIGEVR